MLQSMKNNRRKLTRRQPATFHYERRPAPHSICAYLNHCPADYIHYTYPVTEIKHAKITAFINVQE